MSYLGTNGIGKLYLGSTQVGKMYLGSQLVYQYGSGPTPPPVVTPVFYNCLYFDGTAYIETDYVLPANCSIRVTLGNETLKGTQQVFEAQGSNGGYIGLFYGGLSTTTRRQTVPMYDSSSYIKDNRYLNFSYSTFDFFMTPYRFGWGTSSVTYNKGNLHPDGPLIFGSALWPTIASISKFTGMMAQIEIFGSEADGATTFAAFDSYTPVATFRPCTYNGEAGLWYVEGNKFFGNSAGSGTLTASNT